MLNIERETHLLRLRVEMIEVRYRGVTVRAVGVRGAAAGGGGGGAHLRGGGRRAPRVVPDQLARWKRVDIFWGIKSDIQRTIGKVEEK